MHEFPPGRRGGGGLLAEEEAEDDDYEKGEEIKMKMIKNEEQKERTGRKCSRAPEDLKNCSPAVEYLFC